MPPTIVTLCGSTRFSEAFRKANLTETLAGRIVLTIGADFKSDDALGLTEQDKKRLDELHLRKIDLCDEVLVLNVDGYVGASTANEIRYAAYHGKRIRWLEPPSREHGALAVQVLCIECGSPFVAPGINKCRSCADGL